MKITKPRKFCVFYDVLIDKGWQEQKTDIGRCFFKCKERQCLVLNAHEMILTDQQKLEINWFFHSNELFNIRQVIAPNKLLDWLPLTALIENPKEQQVFISVLDINEFTYFQAEEIVKRITNWGQKVNVEKTIQEIASNPIGDVGGLQLKHLAALAYIGEFITLMDYQDSFRNGNRLKFVPMIKSEMIDRALDIALERSLRF